MIFLSNLVGLDFRLAQNRKRLVYQTRRDFEKRIEQKKEVLLSNDSDFFDKFLEADETIDSIIEEGTFWPSPINQKTMKKSL